ncbi:ADP-ribosylation factor-related protein 1 isoform X2 [Rhineura floridana]|uniref:ADP-ribosylation factor-related protein 1 isoform X2 n=1 Tax=Rhineura floridana TaxID=261503 RepID=UPI002AC7FFF2|nr:ADP-ribosylation factor-related protein 1 isoform X2 [Rhineura floridana]
MRAAQLRYCSPGFAQSGRPTSTKGAASRKAERLHFPACFARVVLLQVGDYEEGEQEPLDSVWLRWLRVRMYTLLSGLYKYMFRRDEYCILILGLDNAGKTTFLEQTKTRFNKNYKGMSLSKITTTVGLNIGTIDVGKARLMFWDLGGQEELQSLWDKYYAESHGVIYIIDSTDEERLSESKRAFEKMVTSEVLEGVPLLVLANKQDVENCLSIPDIKTAFSDCINKIGKRDCLAQGCSALTGKGVNEGIEWMVKCMVRNIHRPPRQKDIT